MTFNKSCYCNWLVPLGQKTPSGPHVCVFVYMRVCVYMPTCVGSILLIRTWITNQRRVACCIP